MTLPDRSTPKTLLKKLRGYEERMTEAEAERDLLRWRLLSVERALNEVADHHDISSGAIDFIQRALEQAQQDLTPQGDGSTNRPFELNARPNPSSGDDDACDARR